jgi:hypothetical protein
MRECTRLDIFPDIHTGIFFSDPVYPTHQLLSSRPQFWYHNIHDEILFFHLIFHKLSELCKWTKWYENYHAKEYNPRNTQKPLTSIFNPQRESSQKSNIGQAVYPSFDQGLFGRIDQSQIAHNLPLSSKKNGTFYDLNWINQPM